ncbi:hypothetical protein [Pigmentibacter ruber]|uniref:hypothetical protein n=1 Tax=Pigmentibacter ruber TaxID=2683196 RepID=UPI00131AB733|nr:hypothetical protein [Pigmentibacter ruber]
MLIVKLLKKMGDSQNNNIRDYLLKKKESTKWIELIKECTAYDFGTHKLSI